MTIITKGPAQEKKDNDLNKAKAAVLGDEEAGGPPRVPTPAWTDDQAALHWYASLRRRRLLSSLCAGLLVLWLLLASVIGGILLFRYIHRRPVFYGWCGTQYIDQDYDGRHRYEKLQERVEIDPDQDYEKIEVPRFGPNRPAIFVHDFRQNLTAIVDIAGGQCFLKPLDRNHNGYYEQNTRVVREKYGVEGPPMTESELRDTGSWMIAEQCHTARTFRLKRRWDNFLDVPHVDDPEPELNRALTVSEEQEVIDELNLSRAKRSTEEKSYRFYNGKEIVNMVIEE